MLHKLINRIRRKPVVYDESFFSEAWFKEWKSLQMVLASLLEQETKWNSVLDFGCGPGVMIDLMHDNGIDYVGCDYSEEARQLYLEHFGKYPERYYASLDDALVKNYDLLLSFDVFEHMRDEEIKNFLEKIKSIPEMLLNISRARGIPGHINIKSDHSWVAFMNEHGYRFEEERTQSLRNLYAQLRKGSPDQWDRNLFLFKRVDLQ